MIIPTVLEKDFKKVKEKIKLVEDYVKWVQLDIMDGVFVNNEMGVWNPVPIHLSTVKIKRIYENLFCCFYEQCVVNSESFVCKWKIDCS